MDKFDSEIFGEEKNSVSMRERLSGYLSYWPVFLVCMVLSIGVGMIYAHYTVPRYMATTSFVIKGAEGGKPVNNDLIENAMNGKGEINENNVILLVQSMGLMERTVAKNNFNLSYFKKGKIIDVEVYKDAPFSLLVKHLPDTGRSYTLHVKGCSKAGGHVSIGTEKAKTDVPFRWNEAFTMANASFVLTPKKQLPPEGDEYIVQWNPVPVAAAGLSKNLTVKSFDTKTSVIQLSLKTENKQKGKDVLNALFSEFNLSDVEDREKLSQATMQFIDDRLAAISGELKGVEGNLESFQHSNSLSDVPGQASQSLEFSGEAAKMVKDLAIQQRVVDLTIDYFLNPINKDKLVPSSLGVSDPTLSDLVKQYNEVQLRKEREAPQVAPSSTVMQDLESQITALKGSILTSLRSIKNGLRLQENNFRQQTSLSQSFLAALPHNERVMQEIKRKQSITEGLYLYLLQKREETAISGRAANVASYRQIDLAQARGPIEPDTRNILLSTGLLGFVLALAIVGFRNMLNDKIMSRDDIGKQSGVPVIGQISHLSKRKKQILPALGHNSTGEQFRAIRMSLSFRLKEKGRQVIMITSTVTGEGKSFVSLNLAAVCAVPGKKVALLEFDMRKPALADHLNLAGKGLADYLSGEVSSLADIRYDIEELPTFHLYPCGSLPVNAADLLLKENINRLFAALRQEYDYIIVDSPPAGIVSDAFVLGSYSDLVLFVVRSQKTRRNQISFINEVAAEKTMGPVAVIINDVKRGEGYGYGYGNYGYNQYENVTAKKREAV